MRSLLAVCNVLGILLMLFTALFLLPMGAALLWGEDEALIAFSIGGGASLVVGALLYFGTRFYRRKELKSRDAYLLVTLGGLTATAIAALPMMLQAPYPDFTDAYFEAMSGLTTTGSTVLSGIDALPHALKLWRSALHWVGGMGIIVLAVAILPLLGVGGMQLHRGGTPGPVKDVKMASRIVQTARSLWLVYCGLTAACVLALFAAGMNGFDALCFGFSTMALGAFTPHDASVGFYDSPGIEAVLMVFMVIASLNFATHFAALRKGDPRAYSRDPEARWVVVWIVASVVALTMLLWTDDTYASFGTTLRHVAFSVVSMATTTGYVTVDFSAWPIFAPMWMLFLGCVTCSTGSTGGGVKNFRVLILMKQALRETFVLVHPQAVTIMKIGGNLVANRVVFAVLGFIFAYFMTVVVLCFALLLSHLDFVSAFSAVIASINNTGPGLGLVGPSTNYSALTPFQTWVCTLAMFLGRVELFTFFVLFTPTFWRK